MMKKLLLIAVLFAGISLVSCQKENKNNGLIDVEITSPDQGTKTEVTPSGVTSWTMDDEVMVVDVDKTPRKFVYASKTPQATAKFRGQLLAGRGSQKYYAYYAPDYSPCEPASAYCLSIKREDLVLEENGILNAAIFGEYCPMVAIPATFDIEDPGDKKGFEFYHVNTLIEARIASDPDDGRLTEISFDKIVLSLYATSSEAPFNTEIHIKMDEIVGPPNVSIPYMEVGQKVSEMHSSITLREATDLESLIAAGPNSYFALPIYSLPTTTPFEYDFFVEFFLEDVSVCKMKRSGESKTGLNLAGLNQSDFYEEYID